MGSTEPPNGSADPAAFRELATTPRTLGWGEVDLAETLHAARAATGLHTHGRPRLCLVLAGCFCETVDGDSRHRPSGSLILYPPDVAHDDRFSDRGARCLNVQLPSSGPFAEATGGGAVGVAGVRAVEAAYGVYDAFRAGASPDALSERTRTLLSALTTDGKGPEPPASGVDAVTEARRLVERRARFGIALSGVARAVGVDRYALAREFRARFGCSVGQYRHRVLLRSAREALLASDASLSSVAYRAGFSDQSHFTRIFKRYTGLTPGRYRRLVD